MEKKMFIGVLYITIFVTFCFILLITFIQYRLNALRNIAGEIQSNTHPNIKVDMSPTPTDFPLIWNTYLDRENGFSIEYPSNRTANEHVTNGYHKVDFYEGCMQITSGTREQIEKIGKMLPFSNIDDLIKLEYGQSKSIITDVWDLGGGKKFNLTYTYKKENPLEIGGIPWYSFSVLSNYENHGTLMQYYIENNGKIYFVSSLSGGPCWIKEPKRMLDSFQFNSK